MIRRKIRQQTKFTTRDFPNFRGQHLLHNKDLMNDIVNRARISESDLVLEFGSADYMLKNQQLSIDLALRGVFASSQTKHLKRNLRIKNEVSVAALSEQHGDSYLKQW